MSNDTKALVKRLRALHILDEVGSNNPLGRDGADTIERLESECEKLRGELRLADAIGAARAEVKHALELLAIPPREPMESSNMRQGWIPVYFTTLAELAEKEGK